MIVKEKYETYYYLYSDKDLVLTEYRDGEDILLYSGAKKMYKDLDADMSKIREITEKQHFEYEKRRREKEFPDVSVK